MPKLIAFDRYIYTKTNYHINDKLEIEHEREKERML